MVDDLLQVRRRRRRAGGAAPPRARGWRASRTGSPRWAGSSSSTATRARDHRHRALPLRGGSAVPHHLVDEILLRVVHPEAGSGPGDGRAERRLRGDTDRRLRALKWDRVAEPRGPGEILEAQSAEEDFDHAKALLLCAGGNRQISECTRNWILGYLTAAGHPESVIAAAEVYDDRDAIGDIMSRPRMAMIRAGVVYDALRAVRRGRHRPDAGGARSRPAGSRRHRHPARARRRPAGDRHGRACAAPAAARARRRPTLPRSLHTSIAAADADADA